MRDERVTGGETGGLPILILPGFPTSAIFTFHEFVAPVIRAFAGLPAEQAERLAATLPMRIDWKSTRIKSRHQIISYAVFCLKINTYPNSKSISTVGMVQP